MWTSPITKSVWVTFFFLAKTEAIRIQSATQYNTQYEYSMQVVKALLAVVYLLYVLYSRNVLLVVLVQVRTQYEYFISSKREDLF